ncbi:penicillin acylase family protein [Niveispirillum cyanobacteriorum]|uniref:Acylase n=1 Tax=Niveispirillum cyanobacteriorum TaxID=1612173 RepID=A0A2K9ND73_9PROT|nr:penicillin acylase family protein [Niveispirillum cyanobacteriorum]AUN31054.1 hypothetical protein C0V82_13015 [Niveispirillum cyanobacteriorum]
MIKPRRRRLCRALAVLLLLGTTAAASAADPARIDWDEWQVPHVTAPDLPSGLRALGWAQMRLRGDSIARAYLSARGTLAACVGEEALAGDIRTHQLGIPDRAREWLVAQDPEMRAGLDAYAAGMNRWLQHHPKREGVAACLQTVEPSDPLALVQALLHVGVAGHSLATQAEQWREQRGSNAYAVAPARSADGRTLLLINPHSPWRDPFTVLEQHLVVGDTNIYGMTFPGLPLPVMGFAQRHGWALTFNDVDGVDLYAATLEGDGYRFGDGTRAFTRRTVQIDVRDATGALQHLDLTVRSTLHGPVIAERDGKVLAVRIAGLERPHLLRQLWDMWQAPDMARFKQALAQQQMPITNLVRAGADGSIYYLFNGLSPRRAKGDRSFWAGVVDGGDPSLLWSDYVPFADLPQVENPPGGFVQNANDGPTSASWPTVLDRASLPATLTDDRRTPRGRRSLALMAGAGSVSLSDLAHMASDSGMDTAGLALPWLVPAALAASDAEVAGLGRVLQGWDGTATPASRGGPLFAEWSYLMRRAGMPVPAADIQQLPALGGRDEPVGVPRALTILREAGRNLHKRFGRVDVAWGDAYRIRRAGLDLPSPVGRDELGAFNAGRYQPVRDAGGATGRFDLVDASHFIAAVAFGPSGPEAQGLLAYGNKDDPSDTATRGQLTLFSQGKLRALSFTNEDVAAASREVEQMEMNP